MTKSYTSNRQRDLVQNARDTLLGLLTEREVWPEQQLIDAADMTEKFFEGVMQDLLTDGLVDRHSTIDGRARLSSYRAASAGAPAPAPGPVILTADARRVLDHLAARPDTARRIGDQLNLPAIDVEDALGLLHDAELITCRYVGRLNIYRLVD